MGRKSTIETLPPDLLAALHKWLRDGNITQEDATELLNEACEAAGIKPRSKSAVNRYAQRMEAVGRKIRERREIAKMWVAEFGEAPTGESGKLLIEIVRNFATDTVLKLEEDGEIVDPKALKELAWAIEKLENAEITSDKRIREIRKQALEEGAKKMEAEAQKQGLTPSTIATLKAKFLGND